MATALCPATPADASTHRACKLSMTANPGRLPVTCETLRASAEQPVVACAVSLSPRCHAPTRHPCSMSFSRAVWRKPAAPGTMLASGIRLSNQYPSEVESVPITAAEIPRLQTCICPPVLSTSALDLSSSRGGPSGPCARCPTCCCRRCCSPQRLRRRHCQRRRTPRPVQLRPRAAGSRVRNSSSATRSTRQALHA